MCGRKVKRGCTKMSYSYKEEAKWTEQWARFKNRLMLRIQTDSPKGLKDFGVGALRGGRKLAVEKSEFSR